MSSLQVSVMGAQQRQTNREREVEREAEVQDRTREPAASFLPTFPSAAVDAKLTARRGLRPLHTVHSGKNRVMSLICPILWYIALSYAVL